MIYATIKGYEDERNRINGMMLRVQAKLPQKVSDIRIKLQDKIRDKFAGRKELLDISGSTIKMGRYAAYADIQVSGPTVHSAEFGFRGTVTVKSHLRFIAQSFKSRFKIGGKGIMVKSFQRRINIGPHRFIKPAFAEMETIKKQLQDVVVEALRDG